MYTNAKAFIDRVGLERVGFFTISPPDLLVDRAEASRRFHSLSVNVLHLRYPDGWLRVFERMESGRIHYHLLVALAGDVRTGFDWAAQIASKAAWRKEKRLPRASRLEFNRLTACYAASASPILKAEWSFWRHTAPRYQFGRCEILPIRTNSEGAAKYIGGYVSKHIGARDKEDKGAQVFGCSSTARAATTRFSWNTPRAYLWRRKLAFFALVTGCKDSAEIKARYGAKWAYNLRDTIMSIDLSELGPVRYPGPQYALADGFLDARDLRDLATLGVDESTVIIRPQSRRLPCAQSHTKYT